MSSYKFHIAPRDLLFLRDARPMEASDAGLGGNWPRPDQIWNAFIWAFHRRWPEFTSWEHQHRKTDDEKNNGSSDRFGALKTAGPFPVSSKTGKIYFPCPLDLCADKNGMLHPMELVDLSGTNLPSCLKLAFASSTIGKHEMPQWISGDEYHLYLQGQSFIPEKIELYDKERNIGIGIDSERRTTVEHQLYQAEYLRFLPETRMAVQASCEIIGAGREQIDVFAKIAEEEHIPLILGGQQGVAYVSRHDFSLPSSHFPASPDKVLLRWTLLTPAVFQAIKENQKEEVKAHPGGWLPNWIDSDGQVKLPFGPLLRKSDYKDRKAWRKAIKGMKRFETAKLVAARIGKPLPFSGWDLDKGPKPTVLAVPAGSVYVFEVESHERDALAAALSWHGNSNDDIINRRSVSFGEKGFGLGVCSYLNINQ